MRLCNAPFLEGVVMSKLTELEGIGPVYAEKLAAVGVKTVEQLLEQGKTPKGRSALADATGISGKLILRWVNMADLFRIKGIGEEYADLLEAAGVDTVKELATRNAKNLQDKLEAVNAEQKRVRAVPSEKAVEGWIEQAKELPRIVEY